MLPVGTGRAAARRERRSRAGSGAPMRPEGRPGVEAVLCAVLIPLTAFPPVPVLKASLPAALLLGFFLLFCLFLGCCCLFCPSSKKGSY